MKDSLISVIIPVYGTDSRLLSRCLESVLAQTYAVWELILVDDGADEGCRAATEAFAADPRIRIIHRSHAGVSSARNAGLDAAMGDFITFIDSDDHVEADHLEYLKKLADMDSHDISACCCRYVGDSDGETHDREVPAGRFRVLDGDAAVNDLCYMRRYYPGCELTAVWGKLYSREVIGDIRFDERMTIGEDFVFNYLCFCKAGSIVIGDGRKYCYRMNPSGIMLGAYTKDKGRGIPALISYAGMAQGRYRQALICRLVNIALVMYLIIPEDGYPEDGRLLTEFIGKERTGVIVNRRARGKVRAALIVSFLGYGTMKRVFGLVSKPLTHRGEYAGAGNTADRTGEEKEMGTQ